MILPLLTVIPLVLLAQPAQVGAVGDPARADQTLGIDPGSWGTASGRRFSDDLAALSLCESPKDDLTALLAVDTEQVLSLSLSDGSSWSSPSVLASDVGTTDSTTSNAAFEPSSGRLLIAYRKGSSSLIYFRVYDEDESPALSSEDWFDLGLGGAPSRVLLRPRPGSSTMLLVAASGTTIRAAVWDGTGFADTTTLDSSFDNNPGAIDAEWSGPTAYAVWARSTDTTPRGSEFDGDAWSASLGLPTLADPIQRVRLMPSNDRNTNSLLVTLVSSDGASLGLHGATFADETWSVASTLSAALADEDLFGASWETSGGGAVAVWGETGETTLHAARWDGTVWGAAAESGDLGAAISGMVARPAKTDTDGVHVLVRTSIPDPRLEDYLMYADSGPIELGMSSSVTGTTSVDSGVVLPDPPAVSAGTAPVTIGSLDVVTLSPGDYGSLSINNNATLNTSTGQYVFGSMTRDKNNFRINADTTSGPVVLIFAVGDFHNLNQLTLAVTGPGPFEIHILDGDFITENSADINASIIVYNGKIEVGNSAGSTAHLVASKSIRFLNSVTISPPSWDSPFIDGRPPTYHMDLAGLTVTAGSLGSTTTIASEWAETHDLPFDLSWRRPTGGVRVTSWREVPSYTDAP